MNKTIKFLAVTATLFAVCLAKAEQLSVSTEAPVAPPAALAAAPDPVGMLIDKSEYFKNKQRRARLRREFACENPLTNATQYVFAIPATPRVRTAPTVVARPKPLPQSEDSSLPKVLVHNYLFNTPGKDRMLNFDATDDDVSPEFLLEALNHLDEQQDPILQEIVRFVSAKRVLARLNDLRMHHDRFESKAELDSYAHILFLTCKDAFNGSPEDVVLLKMLTSSFYAEEGNFPEVARYKLLGALLAGLDLHKAIEMERATGLEPKIVHLVQEWRQEHFEKGMEDPMDGYVAMKLDEEASLWNKTNP